MNLKHVHIIIITIWKCRLKKCESVKILIYFFTTMNSPRLTYSPKLTLSPRLSQLRKYHISDKLQNFHGKVSINFFFFSMSNIAVVGELNSIRYDPWFHEPTPLLSMTMLQYITI